MQELKLFQKTDTLHQARWWEPEPDGRISNAVLILHNSSKRQCGRNIWRNSLRNRTALRTLETRRDCVSHNLGLRRCGFRPYATQTAFGNRLAADLNWQFPAALRSLRLRGV